MVTEKTNFSSNAKYNVAKSKIIIFHCMDSWENISGWSVGKTITIQSFRAATPKNKNRVGQPLLTKT